MSWIVIYQLACDGPDCTDAYPAPATELHSRRAMWAGARKAGWTGINGERHWCPDCSALPARRRMEAGR